MGLLATHCFLLPFSGGVFVTGLVCIVVLVLAAQMQGRVEVHVTTASPIDEGQKLQIAETMQQALGRPVDMVTEIREDLIGGVVVRVGDSVYDGSVASQLKQLREKVMDSTNEMLKTAVDRMSREGT